MAQTSPLLAMSAKRTAHMANRAMCAPPKNFLAAKGFALDISVGCVALFNASNHLSDLVRQKARRPLQTPAGQA